MAGGRCEELSGLPAAALAVVEEARRGVLATIDAQGRPHAVPVCYALVGGDIVSPIDAKPKSGKPLVRRSNLRRDPVATFLVDRWSEDWSRLGWVMVRGRTRIEPSGFAGSALVERYPQYADGLLGDEAIVLTPSVITWWLWAN